MPSVWRRKRRASDHITGVAVVPIRVPTPITTSTRSSIHFIENPKKSPLVGELIRPSSHAEDGGRLWINRSVSPHQFRVLCHAFVRLRNRWQWRINESSYMAQFSGLPPCSIKVSALALILMSASITSNGGSSL